MIQALRLINFKNFIEATLHLGPLTVLIGANASGKSNIRDAFRFLHGIGRNYDLAEILGEKYVGGERVWSGIRGGTREIAYFGTTDFSLGIDVEVDRLKSKYLMNYTINVDPTGSPNKSPYVLDEKFDTGRWKILTLLNRVDKNTLRFEVIGQAGVRGRTPPRRTFSQWAPILVQLAEEDEPRVGAARDFAKKCIQRLESFRFLDLSPTQLRIPSLPGLTTLGDRGENLSSVLSAICQEPSQKEALLEWVRKLTPMDVDDFHFEQDSSGRILLSLKERNGRVISANSASDGTLRFLAILAAIFGPNPAAFYFIEELENGIHPTRLGLLVDLIEHQTKRRNIQVVATCHSPLLLQFLSEKAFSDASIVYRLPDRPDAKIKRLVDVPEARRVVREQSVSILHASSWFEDALNFAEGDETDPVGPERGL